MHRLTRPFRSALPWRLAILAALCVALALVFLVQRPVLALYHIEAGGAAMDRAQAFRVSQPAAGNQALDEALRHFQRAVELGPTNGYAYRRLGQAWLLVGNSEAARQAFARAAELRPHDPLVHIELGRALDGLGQAEKAVVEFEQGRYGPAANDAMVNYLKLADWRIAAGSGDVALPILLDKVLPLDRHSLPALQRVASIYKGMGKDASAFAAPIRGQLQQFALESVAVPSSTLLPSYLAKAMLSLVADGTWTRETLLNVVGYQVWQFAEGAPGQGTEQLLQTLVERRPDDLDLRFYLAELYHRRGDLDQAEANYRRVLEQAPGQPAAMARLEMVTNARGGVASASTAGCQSEADAADVAATADLFGVPASQVELGANILPAGSNSSGNDGTWAGWRYNNYLGAGGKGALFVHGSDRLSQDGPSLRIDTLWREQTEPISGPYAEHASDYFPVGPGTYLVSVDYSLERTGRGIGLVFWGEQDASGGATLLHADLPATDGQPSTARLLADGPTSPVRTMLMLRNWSHGSLIVTRICVKPIHMAQPRQTSDGPGRDLSLHGREREENRPVSVKATRNSPNADKSS